MKILTVLCPVHQSIHLMRTDHILLATRVKILRADKGLQQKEKKKKNSQIPFWIGHPVTPTFEPLSSQGCHLYITLWHMWMHVNTRKTKTGCSKNTDASRPAANTLINLLRFYLIKNVLNWKSKKVDVTETSRRTKFRELRHLHRWKENVNRRPKASYTFYPSTSNSA